MAQGKLNKRVIDALEKSERDQFLWDEDLSGFGLKVTPAGGKVFIFQYRLGGRGSKTKRWTIGRYGAPWTPAKARDEAERLSILVAQGVDPVAEQKERDRIRNTKGFDAYVETFAEGYLEPEWGKSWKQAKRVLEMHAVPVLGDKPIPDIGAEHIYQVLDKLRQRPGIQRTTWAVLSALFRWAAKRDDIARSPMEKVDPPAGAKARKRVLTPDELRAIWHASYDLEGPRGALVRLLMITLQRRSEVAGMPWSELDQERSLWRIDGERAKNEHDHLVPLSPLALAELEAIGWSKRGLILPSSTGKTPVSNFSDMKEALDGAVLSYMQKAADAAADERGEDRQTVSLTPWRLHDLRRTGTTNLQALGFPIEVTERVINHHQGGEASEIGRAVQQECRDRSRMPSSA
eukprot:TRINITY_DN3092_c1_g1_i4.p1 TRINITY_DN3092_c1_g1~~TRINITY_DN3092_c1_g1_i4.p1  ORF type:complete len:404 (-),score=69.08 TRINITY_DN3092_c1_g1_i4:17-1228(-)